MDPMIDRLRERLARIAADLAEEVDPAMRTTLEVEQSDLRDQVRILFSDHPEGRAMLEQELASLERRLAQLEAQQIKKAKISMGGGGPSGGGLEPRDVYYLRQTHEKWNDVPALRDKIKDLQNRLDR